MLASSFPSDFLNRPKKGFGAPMDDWFRGKLGEYARDVFESDSPLVSEIVGSSQLRKMLILHQSGEINVGDRLWSMLVLCQWLIYWS
jgi:asparagine synthase (glutamine-hydrolysing)